MPDPVFTFFHFGSTPSTGTEVSSGNPLDFGQVQKGLISTTVKVEIWNDRDQAIGSDPATAPRFYVMNNDPDDITEVLAGTAANGFVSMLQARSCEAFNVAADAQPDWTPIDAASYLVLGDIPSGAMRRIELRLVVPIDATVMPATKDLNFRLSD